MPRGKLLCGAGARYSVWRLWRGEVLGNVVYRVAHTPIHLHNSRDCRVENNVFALGGKFQFDLHGWVKEQSFYQSHIQTMIDGYESVADQPAWREYLARSAAAFAADKKFYAAELTALGLTKPLVPSRGRDVPLKQPADWYLSVEALRAADNLVSFQTPAGGWNKNTDFTMLRVLG
jgi:hypothetical protein